MDIDTINMYLGKMHRSSVQADQLTLLERIGTDEVYRVADAKYGQRFLLVRHAQQLAWLWQHSLPLHDLICYNNGTGKYIWK